ncbi:MAG: PhoH family protein [Gammaproteobacteria bacterium]|nr:PhoH family protein [Gammaproteobacteria bacterium]
MHDPAALFRFQEHDLYLAMVVLEELDAAKKGVSEVARNARQASRFLDDLIDDCHAEEIAAGLPLVSRRGDAATLMAQGRLFLQTADFAADPALRLGKSADNGLLAVALALRDRHGEREVVLVSKDINLRIKARILGIGAEDYFSDRVLDDVDLLYTGTAEVSEDYWREHQRDIVAVPHDGQNWYELPGLTELQPVQPNQCLSVPLARLELIARRQADGGYRYQQAIDYTNPRNNVWGILARNREQNFALNLLLDPDLEFITLLGAAGTGKTLLALAAGLVQTVEQKRYREIIVTRETVPLGEDIGYLPGTEEEKMTPWMGALMDNLEVLTQNGDGGDWGRAATGDLLSRRIKVRSLNYMRGRTFLNRYIIIDEAQNLTSKQMKTLITRAGSGTKIVCLGNIAQIDTPYLSATTSGLTYVVDSFKPWPHAGHLVLQRGERSRLADYASAQL